MTGGENLIEVRNLVKRYGDTLAVNDISFTFDKGKIYGFLGPNGAGKSTTMNIMTGYLSPTEGEVLVDGEDIIDEPEKAKRKIGYLPEIPPLYSDQTVREYLNFSAALKYIPRAQRKKDVDKVMDLCKIRQMENKLTHNLSKGYRQRVGLAQALIGMPEIIILDEPSVGLDPKQVVEMRELISGLRRDHIVILSSHILSEVAAVCDEVVIISNGKLVADDSLKNLSEKRSKNKYLNMTVSGNKAQIEEHLKSVLKNLSFTVRPSAEGQGYDVLATVPVDSDYREQLFYEMANAKLPIIRMNQDELSLEDIFLQLTGNAGSAKKGAGK